MKTSWRRVLHHRSEHRGVPVVSPAAGRSDAAGEWPLDGFSVDSRAALRDGLSRGPVALVTIIALEGGGPRPIGTQMVVGPDTAEGFLSNGCIEADVVLQARESLSSGQPRRIVYGRGSPWFDIRLLCGARIELLVEIVDPFDAAVARLLQLTEARIPALWATDGHRRFCGVAGREAAPEGLVFSRRFDPLPRLIVVGADPAALAICILGIQAGFETYLVRPMGPRDAPPIAGLRYRRVSLAEAFPDNEIDAWTSVAVCTHDPVADTDALAVALASSASYVGLLTARRRVGPIRDALEEKGLAPAQIDRLRAPIGLAIGGRGPFDIAVAVIAEMIAVANGKISSLGVPDLL